MNPQGKKSCSIVLNGYQYFAISSCWFGVLRHIPRERKYHKPCCGMLSEPRKTIGLWKSVHAPAAGRGPVPHRCPADGLHVDFGWFGEQGRLTLSTSQLG